MCTFLLKTFDKNAWGIEKKHLYLGRVGSAVHSRQRKCWPQKKSKMGEIACGEKVILWHNIIQPAREARGPEGPVRWER